MDHTRSDIDLDKIANRQGETDVRVSLHFLRQEKTVISQQIIEKIRCAIFVHRFGETEQTQMLGERSTN